MTCPSISIALTTFNGEAFIAEQLDSLLRQTLQPFEIVICDDTSDDNTIAIIKDFLQLLPIKLYINHNRMGINQTFERAIDLCTGDYIALCDQDDVWLENKLKILYSEISKQDNTQPILVRSNSYKVNSDLSENSGPIFSQKISKSLYKTFFHPNAQGAGIMFNTKLKELIIPFPQGIHSYDFCIMLIAELFGQSIYISQPLMLYRLHRHNAVGFDEPLPVRQRLLKGLRGDFCFYVPSAFDTLQAIHDCERFLFDEVITDKIENILMLNSGNLSRWKKISILFLKRMAGFRQRFILGIKLLLQNS